MSAVRGYAEAGEAMGELAHSVIGWSTGAKYPDILELSESAALCREAAALLAGVAATLPTGVTVEQIVAENARLKRRQASVVATEAALDALDLLLPPCPTCGGTGEVRGMNHTSPAELLFDCPDCDHGKVTVAQMAALWEAVHDDESVMDSGAWADGAARYRDHLRSVRPREATS